MRFRACENYIWMAHYFGRGFDACLVGRATSSFGSQRRLEVTSSREQRHMREVSFCCSGMWRMRGRFGRFLRLFVGTNRRRGVSSHVTAAHQRHCSNSGAGPNNRRCVQYSKECCSSQYNAAADVQDQIGRRTGECMHYVKTALEFGPRKHRASPPVGAGRMALAHAA